MMAVAWWTLCLQKLLDVLNALLCCHADDVIQRLHVDQHLHGVSDQVPGGRHEVMRTPAAAVT